MAIRLVLLILLVEILLVEAVRSHRLGFVVDIVIAAAVALGLSGRVRRSR
jgi:hypothetical protein